MHDSSPLDLIIHWQVPKLSKERENEQTFNQVAVEQPKSLIPDAKQVQFMKHI